MFAMNILAQADSGALGSIFGAVIGLVGLAVAILMIASAWKIFEKAGHPGWASIVPIYNLYIMLQIIERPTWWLILLFIPMVNAIVILIIYIELAQAFGKDLLYGLGMVFLSVIFFPMLGFGDSRYQGASPLF